MSAAKQGARLSRDRRYRYLLWREWDSSRASVVFVGLNPSSADEREDDPTIRRCCGFARAWGYGGVRVVNLFAYRTARPRELWGVEKPVGARNDWWISLAVEGAGVVVAAWGACGGEDVEERIVRVRGLLREVWCLGVTKGGRPRHPLYVRGDARLTRYR